MIETIIYILERWIWSDSKILWFLIWFIDSIWPITIKMIEVWIASFIWITFLVNITIWKYLKYKNKWRGKWVNSFKEYLILNKSKLFFSFFIWTAAIYLIFSQWLFIKELGDFIYWFWDWYNSWLSILFWYKTDSVMYEYYNIGRWLLLIIIMLFSAYNWIMYHTIGEHYKSNWETTTYYQFFKISLLTLLVIIIVLFSVIPDLLLNWLLWFFWNESFKTF